MELRINKKQGRRLLGLLEASHAWRRPAPRLYTDYARWRAHVFHVKTLRRAAQRRAREDAPLVAQIEKGLATREHVHRWRYAGRHGFLRICCKGCGKFLRWQKRRRRKQCQRVGVEKKHNRAKAHNRRGDR